MSATKAGSSKSLNDYVGVYRFLKLLRLMWSIDSNSGTRWARERLRRCTVRGPPHFASANIKVDPRDRCFELGDRGDGCGEGDSAEQYTKGRAPGDYGEWLHSPLVILL